MPRVDSTGFGARIDVRELFEQDRIELLRLLGELTPQDWERPTAAAPWVVRDLVAHLLGDDLGRLARSRDGHRVGRPAPHEEFAAFIHRLNDEWVRAAARLSPQLLIDMLQATSPQVLAFWRQADLDATGEPVSWVSPDPAPVWLDCARDFTEYWVHQQQIREATGRTGGLDWQALHAVLDTFLRAMPRTLARQDRAPGAQLIVTVAGPAGGRWSWLREDGRWWPSDASGGGRTTTIAVDDAEVLWRLCVRMIEPEEAQDRVHVAGNDALAAAALQIVSIIR
jgi:uncharacterized protein (TIGR03083 family)